MARPGGPSDMPLEIPAPWLPVSPAGDTAQSSRHVAPPAPREAPPLSTTDAVHVRRPVNAWLLYRNDRVAMLDKKDAKRPQSELSKAIAAAWKAEPEDVRRAYEEAAEARKVEHAAQNPGYKYTPRRKEPPASPRGRTAGVAKRGSPRNRQVTGPPQPTAVKDEITLPPTARRSITAPSTLMTLSRTEVDVCALPSPSSITYLSLPSPAPTVTTTAPSMQAYAFPAQQPYVDIPSAYLSFRLPPPPPTSFGDAREDSPSDSLSPSWPGTPYYPHSAPLTYGPSTIADGYPWQRHNSITSLLAPSAGVQQGERDEEAALQGSDGSMATYSFPSLDTRPALVQHSSGSSSSSIYSAVPDFSLAETRAGTSATTTRPQSPYTSRSTTAVEVGDIDWRPFRDVRVSRDEVHGVPLGTLLLQLAREGAQSGGDNGSPPLQLTPQWIPSFAPQSGYQ